MENGFILTHLGPSDAIWHWGSWSTLVQVMACCLMAPSHYLNQCWLIISKVLWHLSEDIIIRRFEDTNQWSKIKNCIFKITLRSNVANELKEDHGCNRMAAMMDDVVDSHEFPTYIARYLLMGSLTIRMVFKVKYDENLQHHFDGTLWQADMKYYIRHKVIKTYKWKKVFS